MASFEFTAPVVHVGGQFREASLRRFLAEHGQALFEEFARPVVICVVPPHAAMTENLEQAVMFFSGDDVSAIAESFVFAD